MVHLENRAHDEGGWVQTIMTYCEGHDVVQKQPHATPERAPKAGVDGSQRFLAG
jgi:hypothetical protein